MRLATINIWSGLDYQGTLRCGVYETRAQREDRYQHLLARLQALDADVITINEANPVSLMMRRLARDLGYDQIHWRGLAGVRLGPFGIPANLDEGDGILARRTLRLTPVRRVRLTGGLLRHWGSLNVSNATQLVCGRICISGRTLFIFNTHWTIARTGAAYAAQQASRTIGCLESSADQNSARSAHLDAATTRLLEARRTVRALRRILPLGVDAVLAGDFNAAPGTPEICAIEEDGFTDVFRHLHPSCAGATWNPVRNDIIRKFYNRGHKDKPVRVDYIFVTESLRPYLKESRVALDTPADRPHPSDHFALVCDLDRSL